MEIAPIRYIEVQFRQVSFIHKIILSPPLSYGIQGRIKEILSKLSTQLTNSENYTIL